jgi:hypothetical protein
VIQREISRALVLNLSGDTGKDAVPGTAREKFVLDSDFALIEGHPICFSAIVTTKPVILSSQRWATLYNPCRLVKRHVDRRRF